MSKKNEIKIYGFGVVAQGFHNYLIENKEEGRLNTVIIKNPTKSRKEINAIIETTNENTVCDKDMDVIVELISSSKEAFGIVVENLEIGKKVISANKKFIAENLAIIINTEQENGGTFLYEGAVCGSIPIIRILNDLYANEPITEIKGIFNGSSNYILTQLFNKGVSYDEALIQAQKLGFAEANPISDVAGFDAKYKLIITAAHAFGLIVKPEEVLNIGIQNITKKDIEFSKQYQFKIKLIAKAVLLDGKLILSVLPTFISNDNDLFNVENEYNAVQINSENIGEQFYKGRGAGSLPTGAVVYSDLKAIDNNYQYSYKKVEEKNVELGEAVILIYSEQIEAIRTQLKRTIDADNKEFYEKISISDLIKITPFIHENKISIIAVSSAVQEILDGLNIKNDDKHKIQLKKMQLCNNLI